MKMFNRISSGVKHLLHQPTGRSMNLKPGVVDIPEDFAALFGGMQGLVDLGLEPLQELHDTPEPFKEERKQSLKELKNLSEGQDRKLKAHEQKPEAPKVEQKPEAPKVEDKAEEKKAE